MKAFDQYVAIDWSGAKSPIKTKSIALSFALTGNAAPHISGKLWSRSMIFDWIEAVSKSNKRTFLGIDCNFGYAQTVLEQQLGKDAIASDLWAKIEDICSKQDNFFAGSFWDHPVYKPYFWTSGKKEKNFKIEQRATEKICTDMGLGKPESPFKLIGAKQVGKGGLSGMRLIHALKKKLGKSIAVFPFDQNYDDAKVVITEIYPRLFIKLAGFGNNKVRTLEDLNTILAKLGTQPVKDDFTPSDHEADAIISAAGLRYLLNQNDLKIHELFHPPVPQTVLEKEGWIFGVSQSLKDRKVS